MICVRVGGSKSWLDPRSMHSLSMNLAHRMIDRCKGKRGVFVTLTYRRDEYADPRDLYRKASDQQHVPLFLRKVSRYLGEPLKGKWMCKLEFQRGGWVHWHIIILDVKKVPHAQLTRMWGKGHVWVNRLSPKRIKYCCKYVCKGGDVPAWLYAEPSKSVKVIRVSPGFWGDPKPSQSSVDAMDDHTFKNARLPMYRTIGQSIDSNKTKLVAKDENERFQQMNANLAVLLVCLMAQGHSVVGNDRGWIVLDCDWQELDRAVGQVQRMGAAAAEGGGGPMLHLTNRRNRDVGDLIPAWLKAVFYEIHSPEWIRMGAVT